MFYFWRLSLIECLSNQVAWLAEFAISSCQGKLDFINRVLCYAIV